MISGAIKGQEWPRTETEIHLLRSSMFAVRANIRDMERDRRREKIRQISRSISEVAPKLQRKALKYSR